MQFHDGAELTADDVKATFDRIAKPPQGISIPRSILFKAVSEINAKDPYTIEFKLAEPRPKAFIMLAIASGWNVIVRKKTLEENDYNLRKLPTYPSTGPFRTVRYVENEVRVVEKNPNYWNKGLPYLDGIEFYMRRRNRSPAHHRGLTTCCGARAASGTPSSGLDFPEDRERLPVSA